MSPQSGISLSEVDPFGFSVNNADMTSVVLGSLNADFSSIFDFPVEWKLWCPANVEGLSVPSDFNPIAPVFSNRKAEYFFRQLLQFVSREECSAGQVVLAHSMLMTLFLPNQLLTEIDNGAIVKYVLSLSPKFLLLTSQSL